MRFIFLGTGTSSGIPAIACRCAVCTSADPRDRRLRAGAAIVFRDAGGHERTILIDATPDLRQQALAHGLGRCDAILFTHNHVDHTFGLDEVRRFNVVQRSAIEVYAEAATMEHLRRIYRHIFDRHNNVNDSFVASLTPRPLEPGEPLDLFGLRVTPLRLMHGRLPILGFRFDAAGSGIAAPFLPMAYCTDVSEIPEATFPALAGVRTLALDALRHEPHDTHLTVEQATAVARRVGAAETWFIHIAHDLAHAATEAALPAGIRLAYDGLTLGG